MNFDFKDRLDKNIKNVKFDEPMSAHTTFRIGGRADAFVAVENIDELIFVLSICREENEKVTIIGNGSNMLVGDNGIRGVVVKPDGDFTKICIKTKRVVCGSGILLSKFCSELAKNGLSGLEFAAGIPGSVGGGVFMNAGAYGGSISDKIISVTYLDENLKICTKKKEELDFGYRHSYFSDKTYVICEAEFELDPGDTTEISKKMAEYNKMRIDKQPLEFPSAGSVFKRPEGHFAGKLIQDCGLMGFKIGGAMVSDKHAGFIVNAGGATAEDVLKLIDHIKRTVFDNYGVVLEEEIRLTEN